MKTVLCFGDSNTWGWNPETSLDLIPQRHPRDVRWTGILRKELGDNFVVIEEGLNARTTVLDDPIYDYRSGKDYLYPCLETHIPLDFVVLMLGSNDLKARFSLTAYDIACGIMRLVDIIRTQPQVQQGYSPKLVVAAPAPVGKLPAEEAMNWTDAPEKSKELLRILKDMSVARQFELIDTHAITKPEDLKIDGVHLPASWHAEFGTIAAKRIKELT